MKKRNKSAIKITSDLNPRTKRGLRSVPVCQTEAKMRSYKKRVPTVQYKQGSKIFLWERGLMRTVDCSIDMLYYD